MNSQRTTQRRAGFLSIEAAMWLLIIMIAFSVLMGFGVRLWVRLQLEEAATSIAETASKSCPGSISSPQTLFSDQATATITWENNMVTVVVALTNGTITAQRIRPQEVLCISDDV